MTNETLPADKQKRQQEAAAKDENVTQFKALGLTEGEADFAATLIIPGKESAWAASK